MTRLPEKWCIRGCSELRIFLDNIKNQNVYSKSSISGDNLRWCYFLKTRYLWDGMEDVGNNFKDYTEITFEDFEKYVLNKTPEIKEDMSYLIKVLERCNIK